MKEPSPSSQRAKESDLSDTRSAYTPEQGERLRQIHARVVEARRELDALIGDAYLRPRASIVPVHFLDLASAAEKLRWAEKEWRELDRELAAAGQESAGDPGVEEDDGSEEEPAAHDGDLVEMGTRGTSG